MTNLHTETHDVNGVTYKIEVLPDLDYVTDASNYGCRVYGSAGASSHFHNLYPLSDWDDSDEAVAASGKDNILSKAGIIVELTDKSVMVEGKESIQATLKSLPKRLYRIPQW